MTSRPPPRPGRGALSQPPGRFERRTRHGVDDGWAQAGDDPADAVPDSIATSVLPEHARTIITRNDSPDIAFDQSINPYRGCEHGCVYCLDGDTPVLMADGTSRRIGDLVPGDRIIGTDDDGHARRYVPTVVLAHWRTRKAAWRVALANGTALIGSGDHRFLTPQGWKFVHAPPAGLAGTCLRPGDALMGCADVEMQSINDRRAIEGRDLEASGALRVVSIEPLPGERELIDITTGTGDFVANGVISHNCYARPSHAYVDLSPGLDFETRLFYKADAARLLEQELAKPHYVCKPIMLGANTDPYQPVEKRLRVTRGVLEVLARTRHPVAIVTKGALLERDLDLLADLARDDLVRVTLSLPTLDQGLKRILEPRAASAAARLRLMRQLADAGVPVGVLVAPVIPVLTDHEIERVLEASAAAGARAAGYVMLRLPYEVKTLFREWLDAHFPDTAAHVMSRVAALRAGRDNDPCFGTRMSGQGEFAALVRQRFKVACRRLGLDDRYELLLNTRSFQRPPASGAAAAGQLALDL